MHFSSSCFFVFSNLHFFSCCFLLSNFSRCAAFCLLGSPCQTLAVWAEPHDPREAKRDFGSSGTSSGHLPGPFFFSYFSPSFQCFLFFFDYLHSIMFLISFHGIPCFFFLSDFFPFLIFFVSLQFVAFFFLRLSFCFILFRHVSCLVIVSFCVIR